MTNRGIRAIVPTIAVAGVIFSGCGSSDGTAAAVDELATTAEDVAEPTTPAAPTTQPPAPTPTGASAFSADDAIDVVDAIGQAYNTYDADLFMTVAAEGFQFVDERGTADRATQASYFPALREGGQQGEPTGEPVVISEDPFVVAVDAVITSNFYPPEGRVGTSTYTLVVENGELKVQEHRWTGDPL